jgi:hypothetical protein
MDFCQFVPCWQVRVPSFSWIYPVSCLFQGDTISDSGAFLLGIEDASHAVMHVGIERLYEFVMGLVNLTEDEQVHLSRCGFCVLWLDACVEEKITVWTRNHKDARLC